MEEKGKLFVVGIGPGGLPHMTFRARDALKKSDIIVGYKTYLKLVEEIITGKEILSTGMTKEIDRAVQAVSAARDGSRVSLVSSGDPGIYAMAGLVLEIMKALNVSLEIEIIPGVAALNSCAAALGAPLMHDFASISLSDLMTPWSVIEKRLHCASEADFVIGLYNPRSKKRARHIHKACEIIMQYRSPGTPAGIGTSVTRPDQSIKITTLAKVPASDIGMRSIVIIGNSKTFIWNGYMITPRGYAEKYGLNDSLSLPSGTETTRDGE